MNLVTNAADAIENNVGQIVVGTTAISLDREQIEQIHSYPPLKPGEYVCVRVNDNGAGMSPETKGKIFDPFFTTKAAGHGLGLAAVLGIVKSHKGAISLESELGVGTTFSV